MGESNACVFASAQKTLRRFARRSWLQNWCIFKNIISSSLRQISVNVEPFAKGNNFPSQGQSLRDIMPEKWEIGTNGLSELYHL